jgi:DNA-binding transcriptional LysR family regulator
MVAARDLAGEKFIAFEKNLAIRKAVDRSLRQRGVKPNVAMEFDNIETIKRAIEIDAGVGLLPEPTVDKEVQSGSLVARPLKGIALSRPVGIIVAAETARPLRNG